MREVIRRRFQPGGKPLIEWAKPDLLLIDGGKGQLASAMAVMEEFNIDIPAIGLAKREEEIVRRVKNDRSQTHQFEIIILPKDSHVLHLLQRIRDEAHRFAITYHALLRGKRQIKSELDDIPGVGPATRKKLIKEFGSLRGVRQASLAEVAAAVGQSKAKVVKERVK
jgi:excinuclease ABC subunit C